MKKNRKNKLILQQPTVKNPVAKYAHHFNKAQVFKDKTRYQRNTKHKGREAFNMSLKKNILKAFTFFCVKSLHVVMGYPNQCSQ